METWVCISLFGRDGVFGWYLLNLDAGVSTGKEVVLLSVYWYR